MKKKIILFVCSGNMFRSPIAEAYFDMLLKKNNDHKFFVAKSAGIQGTGGKIKLKGQNPPKFKNLRNYELEWKHSEPLLKSANIDISKHNFVAINKKIMLESSLIIAMSKDIYQTRTNSLLNQFLENKDKIFLLSNIINKKRGIPDVFGKRKRRMYKVAIGQIQNYLDSGYKKIIKLAKN